MTSVFSVALVMGLHISTIASGPPEVTSASSVIRVDPGSLPAIHWTVSTAHGQSGDLVISFQRRTIFTYHFRRNTPVIPETYRSIINYESPKKNLIGFRFKRNVTVQDAGSYTATYQGQRSTGVLFVYGKPTRPFIHMTRVNSDQGARVTLLCRSISTSRPAAHRQPLVVTWYLNGRELESTDNELHLANIPSNRVHTTGRCPWASYACTVHENGSRLFSEESSRFSCHPPTPPPTQNPSLNTIAGKQDPLLHTEAHQTGQSSTLPASHSHAGAVRRGTAADRGEPTEYLIALCAIFVVIIILTGIITAKSLLRRMDAKIKHQGRRVTELSVYGANTRRTPSNTQQEV